jgi:hypothetical protein
MSVFGGDGGVLKKITLGAATSESLGNSGPILARRGGDKLLETSLQMRLIRESRCEGHFRYRPTATPFRAGIAFRTTPLQE